MVSGDDFESETFFWLMIWSLIREIKLNKNKKKKKNALGDPMWQILKFSFNMQTW